MLIKTSKTRSLIGKTRSEQAANLRRVYGGSGGISDENLDKCKFLERKMELREGFLPQALVEKVK